MCIGSDGCKPGVEAAEEMIDVFLPSILERVPESCLPIAGARSERLSSARNAHPAIEVLGSDDGSSAIHARADPVRPAIRVAGGTRIQVLEAAAPAVPTLNRTLGAEGIDLLDGEEIVLADSPRALADACVRLLAAPDAARAIGAAARSRAARGHEYGHVVERLSATCRSFAGRNASASTTKERR